MKFYLSFIKTDKTPISRPFPVASSDLWPVPQEYLNSAGFHARLHSSRVAQLDAVT
jgi:hypothetical protein